MAEHDKEVYLYTYDGKELLKEKVILDAERNIYKVHAVDPERMIFKKKKLKITSIPAYVDTLTENNNERLLDFSGTIYLWLEEENNERAKRLFLEFYMKWIFDSLRVIVDDYSIIQGAMNILGNGKDLSKESEPYYRITPLNKDFENSEEIIIKNLVRNDFSEIVYE